MPEEMGEDVGDPVHADRQIAWVGSSRRLNIGSGGTDIAGFEPWDAKQGRFAAPLDVPDASITEIPQKDMLANIGQTLVVSAITEDQNFINQLLLSPDIERLTLGPFPTNRVQWEQPHEGNLFEFLYHRRAIQGNIPSRTT